MDYILKKFGKKIKELRKQKSLSQDNLADKSGLHRTYISGIERGLRNVSLKNIKKLANGFGVKIEELFKN